MIFTDRTIMVKNGTSSINDTIVLYRGDREVEIRFSLNEGSPFKFGSGSSPNIIEKTEASYGQLVINTPGNLPPIFSEVAPTIGGKIIFTITAEMIDEITEVGHYTFQIRLFDENKGSRATLPEVNNGIEIREPIAQEDVTSTNEVNVATVGYALTTAGTTEDAFDTQGNYNKTTWGTGDRITATKLNKIEAGIDGVNKKVANGGGSGGYTHPATHPASMITGLSTVATSGSYNDLTDKPIIPTRTSELANNSDFVDSAFVSQKIAEASLSGGGSGTSYDDTEVRNDINNIKTELGTAELTTTAKNVKGAINEVVTRCTEIANEANSYFEPGGDRNLFGQDRYLTGYYIDYTSALDAFTFIKSSSGVGKIAIVEIKPNTQYSIVKDANTLTHNNKTMFVYGTDSAIFNQGDRKRALDGLQARVYETHVTFTSTATDNYLYIYFSDDVNATDRIQVTEGETTEFLPSRQFYVPSDKLSVYSIDEANQKFKREDGSSKHITKFYIPSSKAPDYAILDCAYNELPDLTTFYSYFDGLVDNAYVTKTTIGNEGSENAYPINAYRFKPASTTVDNKTKYQVIPKLIITSCIHGEEKPSAFAMLNLCKNLKDNWVGNGFLTYLRFNIELIVIPILNPWGYVNNTRGNYNHVDLNRNFDYMWDSQGSTDPTDQRYRGTSANSENETQAIINFVNAEKNNLLGHIDVHSLGSGDTRWELLYRQEISNEDYEDVFLQIANSNLAETTAKGIAECNVPATITTRLGKIGIGYSSAAIDNYFNSKGIISTCCEVAYRYVDGTNYHTDVNKLNTYFMATCIKNFINTFLYL